MEPQWTAESLGTALLQASTDSDYRSRFLDDTVAALNEKGVACPRRPLANRVRMVFEDNASITSLEEWEKIAHEHFFAE